MTTYFLLTEFVFIGYVDKFKREEEIEILVGPYLFSSCTSLVCASFHVTDGCVCVCEREREREREKRKRG